MPNASAVAISRLRVLPHPSIWSPASPGSHPSTACKVHLIFVYLNETLSVCVGVQAPVPTHELPLRAMLLTAAFVNSTL